MESTSTMVIKVSNLFICMVYFAKLHADSFVKSYQELFWESITFLMRHSQIKMNPYNTGYIEYQWYVMMKIFVVIVRKLLYTGTRFDSHPVWQSMAWFQGPLYGIIEFHGFMIHCSIECICQRCPRGYRIETGSQKHKCITYETVVDTFLHYCFYGQLIDGYLKIRLINDSG